ncbi:uncharacterized protein C9orf40 homolog [Tenrec ecaudatus]|uniref:uncharacterized protein C9orf40 homolog n=1 Tax=Tenrec ecaudatus TaxID=94439 RepID=UPI003F5AD88F
MAKRRAAEPLTFHVPWKRLLLREFTEEPPPPLWDLPQGAAHPPLGDPEPPRKRKIGAGAMAEPLPSPRKRRDGGNGCGAGRAAHSPETGEPPPGAPGPGEEPPRGGGGEGAGRAGTPRGDWGPVPSQHNEEFWQYNTFQYWRNPLPPIDMADIEDDRHEDKLPEATLQGKDEVVEIDMES